MHLSAKYVELSGLKNLIFAIWMIVIVLTTPTGETEVPNEIFKKARDIIRKIIGAKKGLKF